MSHCTCPDLQECHQTTRKETGFFRLINPSVVGSTPTRPTWSDLGKQGLVVVIVKGHGAILVAFGANHLRARLVRGPGAVGESGDLAVVSGRVPTLAGARAAERALWTLAVEVAAWSCHCVQEGR